LNLDEFKPIKANLGEQTLSNIVDLTVLAFNFVFSDAFSSQIRTLYVLKWNQSAVNRPCYLRFECLFEQRYTRRYRRSGEGNPHCRGHDAGQLLWEALDGSHEDFLHPGDQKCDSQRLVVRPDVQKIL
jgi:hypothetical protein